MILQDVTVEFFFRGIIYGITLGSVASLFGYGAGQLLGLISKM